MYEAHVNNVAEIWLFHTYQGSMATVYRQGEQIYNPLVSNFLRMLCTNKHKNVMYFDKSSLKNKKRSFLRRCMYSSRRACRKVGVNHGDRRARAYNGSLRAEPLVRGGSSPEAESSTSTTLTLRQRTLSSGMWTASPKRCVQLQRCRPSSDDVVRCERPLTCTL